MLRDLFKKKKTEPDPIDIQIKMILDEMYNTDVNSDKYPKLMTLLERLEEIKAKDSPDPLSRDTLALVLGNLFGILVIVAYEQYHPMMSKGMSQVIRPRSDRST